MSSSENMASIWLKHPALFFFFPSYCHFLLFLFANSITIRIFATTKPAVRGWAGHKHRWNEAEKAICKAGLRKAFTNVTIL